MVFEALNFGIGTGLTTAIALLLTVHTAPEGSVIFSDASIVPAVVKKLYSVSEPKLGPLPTFHSYVEPGTEFFRWKRIISGAQTLVLFATI